MSITAREAIDAEHERLRSLEEMNGDGDAFEDGRGQRMLDFGNELNLRQSGMSPTSSEIKIKAVSQPIHGQLDGDGEVVTLVVTARLDQIATIMKHDGDGQLRSKTRRHSCTPISVFRITTEQADSLIGVE